MVDSRVLKSPTIIVLLSISFLNSSKTFPIYLDDPMLGAYTFTIVMPWWILPLSIMKCPSVSLFMAFVLKSVLSHVSIAPLTFVFCPFAWNIFSSPSLLVCVSLLFYGGSLVGSMCVGFLFLSTQLPYVI